MSMKRTKQRTAGREKDTETSFWDRPAAQEATWDEAVANQPDDAFVPYVMSQRFEKGQRVQHPKFGKGIIVDVEAARVEILFQDGKKKLGHGQS